MSRVTCRQERDYSVLLLCVYSSFTVHYQEGGGLVVSALMLGLQDWAWLERTGKEDLGGLDLSGENKGGLGRTGEDCTWLISNLLSNVIARLISECSPKCSGVSFENTGDFFR